MDVLFRVRIQGKECVERTTVANHLERNQKLMLYVGIDIAKNKHDLACIDETGEAMITNFRFANSYQGFHHLKSRTNAVVAQQPHPVCISSGTD